MDEDGADSLRSGPAFHGGAVAIVQNGAMGDTADSDAVRHSASRDDSLSVLLFDHDHQVVQNFTFPHAAATTEQPWQEVLGAALSRRCSCLLLDHYVSDRDPRPDARGIVMTRRLCRELRMLGLRLCDHVIRSDRAAFSFRANGLL
jgi:DNA repair protein RadC